MATSNLTEVVVLSNFVQNSEHNIRNGYETEVTADGNVACIMQQMASSDTRDRSAISYVGLCCQAVMN